MMFTETALQGAFVVEPERQEDERGFFARTWCQREFEAHSLHRQWVQGNISFNTQKGTLRGMHFQIAPDAEVKLVRCTMGVIYDVIVDLRPNSPTFLQHFAVILSAHNRTMLYIPEGFAHGFQTLEDHSEVLYQMSQFYAPDSARGIRWNDPALKLSWPLETRIISERDRNYPDFVPSKRTLAL